MEWRKIHRKSKHSEKLAMISSDAYRLWVHLNLAADDFGRISAKPGDVSSMAIPRLNWDFDRIITLMCELHNTFVVQPDKPGLIIMYRDAGQWVLQIDRFIENQPYPSGIHRKKSQYSEPPEIIEEITPNAFKCNAMQSNAKKCQTRPDQTKPNQTNKSANADYTGPLELMPVPADPVLDLLSTHDITAQYEWTDLNASKWIRNNRETFPYLDIEQETRKALNYFFVNPQKQSRSTTGWKKRLTSWYGRADETRARIQPGNTPGIGRPFVPIVEEITSHFPEIYKARGKPELLKLSGDAMKIIRSPKFQSEINAIIAEPDPKQRIRRAVQSIQEGDSV